MAMLSLLAGCAAIPGQTKIPPHRQIASRHHFYGEPREPDLSGSRVLSVPKLNPKWWLENADDPLPWWWKPDDPLDERLSSWKMRNPLHNYTHYVIGVTDRHTHRFGINAHSIWNDKGWFNASITRAGPLLYLPMISNRGPFLEWYVGWRTSGSFGGALRLAQHDSDGTGPRGRSPLSKALAAKEAKEALEREQQQAVSDTASSPDPMPDQPSSNPLPPHSPWADLQPLPPVGLPPTASENWPLVPPHPKRTPAN